METALESSVYVSSPEFAGWLMKRGFHWRKLWKKRWVALHGAEIVYMEKEPTLEDTGNMTITKAQINTETVIDREDLDGNPFGFAIHINDGQSPPWYLRAESAREKKSWLMRLSHVHAIVRWLENFEKVRVLGVGGSGIVHELLHKSNGRRFAMKEMEIKNKTQMQMAIQEAEMLKDIMENVSHPNVMHIEKVFQVGSKFYMVFPLCLGGELYEHIIRRGHFTELDAALLMRDLISGIHALHEHDILHLDIKPENILFDSMGEDAKIKITDFGLSRSYQQVVSEQKSEFTMELMMKKLQAFSDSGELNRERLRGTIGYMSPELILLGFCNKTTDVFAAGVVLYILLCGRPPFNSRSNREVLERTAKGLYKMTGAEWDDISEDAKDLVRKMLDTNPLTRITTGDILTHPWLSNLDEVKEELNAAADPEQSVGCSIIDKKLSTRRGHGANLTGALKQLSGHVQRMRSEKLASSMTRLLSMMQSDGGGRSTLAKHYLIPLDRNADAESVVVEPDAMMMEMMSTHFHTVLTKALTRLGALEDRGIRLDHFFAIMRHFNPVFQTNSAATNSTSSSGSSSSSNTSNQVGSQLYALLLLLRFIDSDSDGFVSMDDLRNSQAQMLQRSDSFLRTIFRVYIEMLWYPGRHLNLINLQQQMKLGSISSFVKEEISAQTPGAAITSSNNSTKSDAGDATIASASTSSAAGVGVLDGNSRALADVVEPPRFITCRHVATAFERAGFDAGRGQEVFRVLCEAAARIKEESDETLTYGKSKKDQRDESSPTPTATDAVNRFSLADSSTTGTASAAAVVDAVPNAALAAAFGDSELLEGRPSQVGAADTSSSAGAAATPSNAAVGNTTLSMANAKMDVADFIRVCALDDILVQVFFQRSHKRMKAMMDKAEAAVKTAQMMKATISEEDENRESDCDMLAPLPSEFARSAADIQADLLAEEIRIALQSSAIEDMTPKKNRLVTAIGGAAMYIAKGAQALKEAAYDLDGSGGRDARLSTARASTSRASGSALTSQLLHDSDDEV